MSDRIERLNEYADAVAPEKRLMIAWQKLREAAAACEDAAQHINPYEEACLWLNYIRQAVRDAEDALFVADHLAIMLGGELPDEDSPVVQADDAFIVVVDREKTCHVNCLDSTKGG